MRAYIGGWPEYWGVPVCTTTQNDCVPCSAGMPTKGRNKHKRARKSKNKSAGATQARIIDVSGRHAPAHSTRIVDDTKSSGGPSGFNKVYYKSHPCSQSQFQQEMAVGGSFQLCPGSNTLPLWCIALQQAWGGVDAGGSSHAYRKLCSFYGRGA